jgi:uncharacterized protein (DUF4213/DUF364 family)
VVAGVILKVLEDLISTLNTEVKVKDIRMGLFHTAVFTRNCGLAVTLPRDALVKALTLLTSEAQVAGWKLEVLGSNYTVPVG